MRQAKAKPGKAKKRKVVICGWCRRRGHNRKGCRVLKDMVAAVRTMIEKEVLSKFTIESLVLAMKQMEVHRAEIDFLKEENARLERQIGHIEEQLDSR